MALNYVIYQVENGERQQILLCESSLSNSAHLSVWDLLLCFESDQMEK